MKRMMMLIVFGALLSAASGCHLGECWRSTWGGRHQQQTVVVSEPCCVSDSPCDSCGGGTMVSAPCSSCSN
jgi:hypothetical protein